MVTHGKGRNFMVFNNSAFLHRLAFFGHGLAFFLKRCLATLSCVIWQCDDRLHYAVFELLLTIPCILDWLLCYICDFQQKFIRPMYIYKIPALVSLEMRF